MTDFYGKVMLLKAAYSRAATEHEYNRQALFNGMFWLCDTMREDIKTRSHPELHQYNVATVDLLQDIIEESFKGTQRPTADHDFEVLCCKFLGPVPDTPEHDQ